MLGLIRKNYFEAFRIKKNIFESIFGYGIMALFVAFGKDFYIFCLVTLIIFPLMGSTPLQYALEQNEICKFDDILLTYPLTKKEIIGSQFLACLSFCGITGIISLMTTFIYVYIHHTTDLKTGLLIWAAGLILSLVFLAVSSVGFFALGNKKGTIVYIILVIFSAFSYAATYTFTSAGIDFMVLFTLDVRILLPIALVVSLLLLVGSYYLCLKIYTKRYS